MKKLDINWVHEEWKYRFQERLGILCGDAEPTREQLAIARREADAWVKEYNEQRPPEVR